MSSSPLYVNCFRVSKIALHGFCTVGPFAGGFCILRNSLCNADSKRPTACAFHTDCRPFLGAYAALKVRRNHPAQCPLVAALCAEGSVHGFLYRCPVGHRADGALFGGDQVGRRIGEPEHLVQILDRQPFQAVIQHKVQDAGTEGIPCTGGLDDAAQGASWLEGVEAAIEGITACRARCHVQKPDVGVLAMEQGRPLGKIFFAGHEQQLVVGDFQDIALAQPPGNLDPGFIQAVPEGLPEVGIEGNQGPCLFGDLNCLPGGGAAGLPGEGKGAKVEDPAVLQQRLVQVGCRQVGVGAGLAIEAEVPVAPRQGLDNGQGGVDLRVKPEGPGVDAGLLDHLGQLLADVDEDMLYIEVDFVPQDAESFGLAFKQSDGGDESKFIYDVASGKLTGSTTNRGEGASAVPGSGLLPLQDGRLTMRVYIDRSLVEGFFNNDKALTLRSYPEDPAAAQGLSVFAEGDVAIERLYVATMGSIYESAS